MTETVAGPTTGRPAADREPAVEAHGLVKRFGEFEAVSDVSFSVHAGEVFAFLGPTAPASRRRSRCCARSRGRRAGHATVAGFDVATRAKAVRRHIGLVFQEQTLDEQLTANENLRFHAVLYRVPRSEVEARIRHVLELVDLADRGNDLVSTFSGGMARRLEIARALLHTPDVLFLDEPTLGLDPQTRALMWEDVLRMRRDEGVTVFLTTHYMDEAEYADRIAIIDHGQIVALDTPTNLKAAVGADSVELRTADDPAAIAALAAAGYDVRPTADGHDRDGRRRRRRRRVVDRRRRRPGPPRARPSPHARRRLLAVHRSRDPRPAGEGRSMMQRAWIARRR